MSLPELDGLGQSDLDSLLSALRSEASDIVAALSDADTADDADLARLEDIATEVEAVVAALAAVDTALAARADKAAAALARINPQLSEDDAEVEAEEVAAEVEAEVEVVAEAEEAVVAAVHNVTTLPPSPRSVVALAPKAKAPVSDTRKVAIVAAAGVPGVRGGQEVTLLDMVKPAVSRWSSYQGVNHAQDELFALKAPTRDPKLVANGRNDQDVMAYAASVARLKHAAPAKNASIIAAGGWCAPAEQRFDICTIAELDGILDVPTIAVPRGSISYFRQLDYSVVNTAVAAGEFTFTNAQLVNPTPVVKPCFEIPCATPVTATLDVVGLCLRAGLLQNKAFPELIAAWMELALISFAHYRNARNIATMVAGSGSALVSPAQGTHAFGVINPLLDWISLQAINYRFDNGMAMDAELEVVLPFWVQAVVDADHIKRQFNSENPVDFNALLARLNVRAQYVKDFQDAPFAGAGAVTTWPATVNVLMFAPGAWIRGTEDVITVSTLVDSTLLQTNRMQLLFFEAADQMMPWCGPSILLTVNICASGATSGPIASVPGAFVCGTDD